MARGIETGWGSWAVLALLLVSSSVVLVLQWNKVRDQNTPLFCVDIVSYCIFYICGRMSTPSQARDCLERAAGIAVERKLVGSQTPRLSRRAQQERTDCVERSGTRASKRVCLPDVFAWSVSRTYNYPSSSEDEPCHQPTCRPSLSVRTYVFQWYQTHESVSPVSSITTYCCGL